MNVVLRYNHVDLNHLRIKDYQTWNAYNYQIPLHYKLGNIMMDKIMIDTPILFVPFGVKNYTNNNDNSKFFLDLSFENMEHDKNIYSFYQTLQKLDSYIEGKKDYIRRLLKLEYNLEYVRQIRTNKKEYYYSPTFKLKLNKNINHDFDIDVYSKNYKIQESIETCIKDNCYVKLIIYCEGLWVVKNKLGITWKIKKIDLQPLTL